MNERSHPDSLASRLSELGFMDLFQRLDTKALDSVWKNGASRETLEHIVRDPHADALPRFLAAEILFQRAPGYPPENAKPGLARIYAEALARNLTGMANPWGLPGKLDGETGRHLAALGEAAVPALAALLGDTRAVSYGGSEEATFGNAYRYRVKDLAAFFIATIRNLPFAVDNDPDSRDRAIEKLTAALSEGTK